MKTKQKPVKMNGEPIPGTGADAANDVFVGPFSFTITRGENRILHERTGGAREATRHEIAMWDAAVKAGIIQYPKTHERLLVEFGAILLGQEVVALEAAQQLALIPAEWNPLLEKTLTPLELNNFRNRKLSVKLLLNSMVQESKAMRDLVSARTIEGVDYSELHLPKQATDKPTEEKPKRKYTRKPK